MTPAPSADADLFEVLSAISISGPDADGLLWVSFKPGDASIGALSIQAASIVSVTLKTVDLEVSGDTAYEVGQADLKVSSGRASVKYIVVWRSGDDGVWRLHRDIWNSMPAG